MIKVRKYKDLRLEPGNPYLLGATSDHRGCNFAIFTKNGTAVTLHLFSNIKDHLPSYSIPLDSEVNKTGDVWHIYIRGIKTGQLYGYTVNGPFSPEPEGHRFDKTKFLLDPYAKAVTGEYLWNPEEQKDVQNSISYSHSGKGVVIDPLEFNWEDDKPLHIPLKDAVIYEMHIRAFTQDPSSGVKHKGTYLGIIEKISYLKQLGINTVEFLPVHEFNHKENIRKNPETGEQLYNFWGYSTLSFFAPDSWFATVDDGLTAVKEFKTMIKALHKAGIQVLLDVVYNHTGEGNELGPTHSFRGFDNSIYYMLEEGKYYKNYSGCGNTLNCNHPVVKQLILDSLRYWVVDMHVDGFRFDLAAILGRDSEGNWVPNYSILNDISHDPILSNTILIAEGWDAAGLYKVGGFPPGWAEWNAQFRDDIRCFIKGDECKVPVIATRMTGSSDLFHFPNRNPYHSINFITAHDGFTLHDLVSYNNKHNQQNGEDNRDGMDDNSSWNHGEEGPTSNQQIEKLRLKQSKNLLTLLFISQGTPMLLAGDEMWFSKQGNNNTYCHDNTFNWLNWKLKSKYSNLWNFTKHLIQFRMDHPVLRRAHFFDGTDKAGNNLLDISWHGVNLNEPDWRDDSHTLAFMLDGNKTETGAVEDDNNFYVAINGHWKEHNFQIPPNQSNKKWYTTVNTGIKKSHFRSGHEKPVSKGTIKLHSRSIVILIEK
ncbi:glycogen debranching protein GlgX [Spirochaeta cellobiosiphila]|uniref:glycogen debranching protein GlgX n=1 Tax=Spirochaeta cellobiosiphila TaxID=504483 RepID=UPI00041CE071|nr:glycogen debranching protein GlgX [Spirochaeta cellobiosiphila]